MNPAAENLLGISEQRAARRSLLQLVGDNEELGSILNRALASDSSYACELRLPPTEVQADERIVDCRVSCHGHAAVDDPQSLIIEMSDVTPVSYTHLRAHETT